MSSNSGSSKVSSQIKRVLIVGAGMAGLTLAISLRRQGITPDVVERQPAWPVHGAGIYLLGNAMRALGSLGIAEEVARNGTPILSQTLLTDRGRKLTVIDTASVWGACGPCIGIRRADLQATLVNALGDLEIRFATTIEAISQNGPSATVQFNDGTSQDYDLIVGADGIRSSVRKLMFGDTQPRFCGQVGWRFIVKCPGGIKGWTLFAGSKQAFIIIPVGHGLAYCYSDMTVPHAIEDPMEGRLERLRTRFEGFAAPVQEALAQLTSSEQIHFGAIEDILQEPWSTGNVLLIGDAAHGTSPNMASGAAMALEDALVLSRSIGSGAGSAQVISDYTDARVGRIRWLHEQTHARDRIRNLPTLVRNLMSGLLANAVYRRNYLPFLTQI
jgi:2-polyprenyl-6-methoxyphenol hydroxylase-like FAD-dependent oxidoreductase